MLRAAISTITAAALTFVFSGCGRTHDASHPSSTAGIEITTNLDWSYELTELVITIDGNRRLIAAPIDAGSHTLAAVARLRHRCGVATSMHGTLRVEATRTFVANETTRVGVEIFTRAPTQAPEERVGVAVHLHHAQGAPSSVTAYREDDCGEPHDELPPIAPDVFPSSMLLPTPIFLPVAPRRSF